MIVPVGIPATKPLNVLWMIDHVCYDGNLHGGGRLFMNLMPRFDERRVKIHPYFMRASKEVRDLFAKVNHPVRTLGIAKYDPTAPMQVAKLCRKHDIDVMHLFCYAASTVGRMVGSVHGIPTVVHDFDTQIYFPYPFYLRILDRALAGSTGHALAASAMCKEYMRDVRRIPGDRIDVLYHAIPTEHLQVHAQLDRATVRARLGIGTEIVFTAVTKLGPERGNETMLQAFAQVVQQLPGARLFIVYKPTLYHRLPKGYEAIDWARDPREMRARIDREVARLGLERNVTMVESLEHPRLYYAASDVLVAPFENIRFSSVNLVEGMAYGRPHVVTAIGEPLELVERYGGGIAVPPADAQALAAAMVRIGRDPQLLQELGRKAYAGAGDLTVDAVADRLSKLYEGLAGEALTSAQPARGRAA